MAIPIYSSKPWGKNSLSCRYHWRCIQFCAQKQQWRALAYTPLGILGQ